MTAAYRSVFRPGLFAGQAGIVTGAGSGIGRCTAHELAALGAKVALVGRRMEKLEAVAREIADAGGTAFCLAADIRDEERVADVVRAALAALGRLDFLVNNAGGQFGAPLEKISAKGWDAVVRNNLTGGFLVAREVYTQWMKQNGGAIVNMIADMWNGMPGMGHSGAARAGMLNLTETAALEWAPVRVNAVAPGWIASSGLDQYPPEMREHIRALPKKAPLGRLGTESEVSAAIVFLLSPAAAFVSGACIRIDGAVPNVKPNWSRDARAASGQTTAAFDGFHLAAKPTVLE
jgi:citronellol/citronellal dehydrogenase